MPAPVPMVANLRTAHLGRYVGPQDPKDVTQAIARDLTGLGGAVIHEGTRQPLAQGAEYEALDMMSRLCLVPDPGQTLAPRYRP